MDLIFQGFFVLFKELQEILLFLSWLGGFDQVLCTTIMHKYLILVSRLIFIISYVYSNKTVQKKLYYGRKCRKQNLRHWFVDSVLYFFTLYDLVHASMLHVPYLSCLSLGSAHLRPFCPSQLVCDRIQDLQSKNGCCMLSCPLEGITDKDEVIIEIIAAHIGFTQKITTN